MQETGTLYVCEIIRVEMRTKLRLILLNLPTDLYMFTIHHVLD